MAFFTTLFMLASCSLSSSNNQYPTYKYAMDVTARSQVGLSVRSAYDVANSQQVACYAYADVLLTSKVYFNDADNYYYGSTNIYIDVYAYYMVDNVQTLINNYGTYDYNFFDSSYSSSFNLDNYRFIIYQSPTNTINISTFYVGTLEDTESFMYIPFYLLNFNEVAFGIDVSSFTNSIEDFMTLYTASESIGDVANGSYADGYNTGYTEGYTNGNNDGASQGYQDGYSDGYQEASVQDSTAVTIFTGICEVGLLPVNVFLLMLNFEVFGINIGGFVASLLTVSIIVIVLRIVLGSKSGGGSND